LGIVFPKKHLYLGIMILRTLLDVLRHRMFQGKAIVLIGPRQVGKTTLIQTLLEGKDHLFLDGDDSDVRTLLDGVGLSRLKAIIGNHSLVFVDEAQRIENVGLMAKMVTDQMKQVQLILSGSSALDLKNATQESLTGRKFEYHLFPIGWQEFENHVGFVEASAQLEERLIYGMYPDVINHRENAREILKQLTSSYLYKDVLALTGIKKPDLLEKLLRALAFQVGSEVSYNELANLLEVDKATISKYIDLLEKSFIVFRLNSYNSNQRNEIKNSRKIYFFDNGIRNMVINNLNSIDLRNDKGALWENFLIAERIKLHAYHQIYANYYFWRTVQKQEVDFIEETNGTLEAFEFKWSSKGRIKLPSTFSKRYGIEGRFIDRENFRSFLRME
jgi:predicted AAA+ superfamily ATPase